MKLEDQVCSLELAKRLKELGVRQESYFTWNRVEGFIPEWGVDVVDEKYTHDKEIIETCAAFTVAELLNMFQVYRKEYILVPVGVHFADYLAQELINEKSPKKN